MYRRATITVAIALGLSVNLTSVAIVQAAQPSAVSCENYARNYAERASRQGQVLRGGAVGSLVGLGIGSIGGAAGAGAAIGAGIGIIGGGVRRVSTRDKMYNAAYQDCMAGRNR